MTEQDFCRLCGPTKYLANKNIQIFLQSLHKSIWNIILIYNLMSYLLVHNLLIWINKLAMSYIEID